MRMIHEKRRIGDASTGNPVRRIDEKCAVEHCSEIARTLRVTESGRAVLYCHAHERIADLMFGDFDNDR